jgi:hypothetical protein
MRYNGTRGQSDELQQTIDLMVGGDGLEPLTLSV